MSTRTSAVGQQLDRFRYWLNRIEFVPQVVYDVGGYVGDFALACVERWPDAEVLSFEPQVACWEINQARARERWRVINVALGSRPGGVVLHRNVDEPSSSSLLSPGRLRRQLGYELEDVPVQLRLLDDYATGNAPALLKVDVEGYELEVLRGASEVLLDCEAIILEVNDRADIFTGSPTEAELIEHLYPAGWVQADVLERFGTFQHDELWTRWLPGRS